MSSPAVVVISLTPDELRALVSEEVRAALASCALAPAPSPLLNKSEIAQDVGVSTATIDRLSRDGRVPYVMVGDVRRYDRAAVRAALASHPAATTKPTRREAIGGVRLLSRGGR